MEGNQFPTSSAVIVPFAVSVSTSAPFCFIDGSQPFSASTTYECITASPIWALIRLYEHHFTGIRILDPARGHRRIGPNPPIIVCEDFDDEERDLQDTVLIRFEPGDKFSTTYAFGFELKRNGKRGDAKLMEPGNTYFVALKKRRVRWMLENQMEGGRGEEQRRDVLSHKEVQEWEPRCRAELTAAA
ncbi:hypothetical protein EJ08DRAFT_69829 [Tothia fuscella]|uniref:Uncharacterized protein n=1 Tax=Tothia fuscella TaxID=1048955 RepID=A0A9P4NF06_9PEZI|nr:hypothetical protein EJ08DRAFT_69829 [Tothia fuscella]